MKESDSKQGTQKYARLASIDKIGGTYGMGIVAICVHSKLMINVIFLRVPVWS